MLQYQSYIICTTPRSGSNLLCDLLSSCHKMGRPAEFLNVKSFLVPFSNKHSLIRDDSSIDMSSYIALVARKFSTQNSVFGIKVLFDQFQPFFKVNSFKQNLQNSHFIWLTRKDVVAQAVSMYIADETNEWTSQDEIRNREQEKTSRRKQVKFDVDKISRFVDKLAYENANWHTFFSVNNIEYKQVFYEDILNDTNNTCHRICNFCDVQTDHVFSLSSPKYKRQGDNLNDNLSREFRSKSSLSIMNEFTDSKVELQGISFS